MTSDAQNDQPQRMSVHKRRLTVKNRIVMYALALLVMTVAACGATPTATPFPPTATRPPAATAASQPGSAATVAPTAVPPTATMPPATATTAPLPTATSAPTKAPTAAAATDPKDAIAKSMRAIMAAKAYRVLQVVQTSTTTYTNTVEMIPPDRFHIVSGATAAGTEIIVVGKNSYQKVNGQWMTFPMDIGSLVQSLSSQASDDAIAATSEQKLVGPDVLDGVPMLVYSYVSKAKFGDVETTGNVKVWIGVADGLPHKQVVEGEAMGYKSTTTQYMTYDPTIKIEAPM
jgi:hypothetical protein